MNESLLATRFPTGSRIFMEGNSQFAQLAVSLICASTDPGLKVWTPTSDGNLGKELNLEHVTTTNDYIAHWPSSNTTLILLDNDDYWATYAPGNMKASKQDSLFRRENHLGRVLGLFDDLNFQPDVFVIGAINGELRAEVGATDWELARSRSARLQHCKGVSARTGLPTPLACHSAQAREALDRLRAHPIPSSTGTVVVLNPPSLPPPPHMSASPSSIPYLSQTERLCQTSK